MYSNTGCGGNCKYKLLFTVIFVFYKLTTLLGNYAEEISRLLEMTFLCKQNRNSKR